jgi:hypothetical protein
VSAWSWGELVLAAVSGFSMGELSRVDGQNISRLGVGVVLDVAAIEIGSDESLSAKAGVGAATGAVVGGVATAITEPGFSNQIVHRYIIRMDCDSYVTKVSRSIVEVVN